MNQRWEPRRYRPMAEYLLPAAAAAVLAVDATPGDLLLDSATGTGNAAVVAVARGLRVLGVDSSAEQIAAARVRCPPPGARFVVADAQHLPVPTGRFAAAVSVFGIIFAADPQRALAELVRCVRPGGRVAFTILRTDGWPGRARAVLADAAGIPAPPFPSRWASPSAAGTAAVDAGLAQVQVRHEVLRFPLAPGLVADQVSGRMGGLAVLRDRLEGQGRWPQARDRLDDELADVVTADGLLDPYLLVVGRRP